MKNTPSVSTGLGVTTVVLTLLGWASVPLFLRHFAESIDFFTSNGWRYGFSALVWAPVLIVVALRSKLPPGLWKAALVPSIVNALGQVCFTWAHYRIDPGLVTFGLRTQLLFVAIGAWIMFPAERAVIRKPGYIIGAVVLLVGMTAVILLAEPAEEQASREQGIEASRDDLTEAPADQDTNVALSLDASMPHALMPRPTGLARPGDRAAHFQGVALAVVSGMLFAAYGLAVRKYMHGVNPVLAFAAICQYTALAMVMLMLVMGNRGGATVLNMPGFEIVMLLGSALIGIAIGHVFYYISIARLGVAVTAGVIQLQPFLVAVGSLWLFNERLTGWQWLGGTIAVSGALLMLSVQWRVSKRKPKIEEPVAIAEGESGS